VGDNQLHVSAKYIAIFRLNTGSQKEKMYNRVKKNVRDEFSSYIKIEAIN